MFASLQKEEERLRSTHQGTTRLKNQQTQQWPSAPCRDSSSDDDEEEEGEKAIKNQQGGEPGGEPGGESGVEVTFCLRLHGLLLLWQVIPCTAANLLTTTVQKRFSFVIVRVTLSQKSLAGKTRYPQDKENPLNNLCASGGNCVIQAVCLLV